MIANQGYIRPSMDKAFPLFMRRWGLSKYSDPRRPVVFFGCYTQSDVRLFSDHRSMAIMVWLGTDYELWGHLDMWKNSHFRHVAIGKWLADDLAFRDLRWRRVNLVGSPLLDTLRPEPLGDAVFAYVPHNKREKYGGHIVDQLRERMPDTEFIVLGAGDVPHDEMPAIYRRCAVGLRLVDHDGAGMTVLEMGAMGRYTAHNGDTPASIPWANVDDLGVFIKKELDTAKAHPEMVRRILSRTTANYISRDPGWLNSQSWEE